MNKVDPYREVSPKFTGIGGAISAVTSTLTGINCVLPFWLMCPIWGIVVVVGAILFPVGFALVTLRVLHTRYRNVYTALCLSSANNTDQAAQEATYRDPSELLSESLEQETHAQSQNSSPASDYRDFFYDSKDDINFLNIYKKQDNEPLLPEEIVVARFAGRSFAHSLSNNLLLFLLTQLFYYVGVFLAYYVCSLAVTDAVSDFLHILQENNIGGTSSYNPAHARMDYTDKLVIIYAIFAAVWLLLMTLCFVITAVVMCGFKNMWSMVIRVLTRCMVGLYFILGIAYCIFVILERYYADLHITAVRAMIAGQDYFDPSIPFIILRLFLGHVVIGACLLLVLMSLHLMPCSFNNSGNNTHKFTTLFKDLKESQRSELQRKQDHLRRSAEWLAQEEQAEAETLARTKSLASENDSTIDAAHFTTQASNKEA